MTPVGGRLRLGGSLVVDSGVKTLVFPDDGVGQVRKAR